MVKFEDLGINLDNMALSIVNKLLDLTEVKTCKISPVDMHKVLRHPLSVYYTDLVVEFERDNGITPCTAKLAGLMNGSTEEVEILFCDITFKVTRERTDTGYLCIYR